MDVKKLILNGSKYIHDKYIRVNFEQTDQKQSDKSRSYDGRDSQKDKYYLPLRRSDIPGRFKYENYSIII